MSKRDKAYTFRDYLNEADLSDAEREEIRLDVELTRKLIEAREARGMTQRDLAEASGLKQPAIARIESMRSVPRVDTLLKLLVPLGYTLSIVPLQTDRGE